MPLLSDQNHYLMYSCIIAEWNSRISQKMTIQAHLLDSAIKGLRILHFNPVLCRTKAVYK